MKTYLKIPAAQGRRLLVAAAVLAGVFSAMAAQAQSVKLKPRPLPSSAVTRPTENVLPPFPLGAGGAFQREVVALTNKARQQAGLKPLAVNRVLTHVAQRHALNMAGEKKMSHVLFGKGTGERLRDAGYSYRQSGENIAWRTSVFTAADIVNAWLASPRHRANILNPNFTEMSIGVAKNAMGDAYFCQVFGMRSYP